MVTLGLGTIIILGTETDRYSDRQTGTVTDRLSGPGLGGIDEKFQMRLDIDSGRLTNTFTKAGKSPER